MNKTAKSTVALASMAMFILSGLMVAATASAGVSLTDDLTTEDGATTALGGGDHFFVKFGTDAAFGIVWGTEETQNNVYFVVIKARYLGVADVYDGDGELLQDNYTMKVYTMYAVKLDSIVEFDDVDDNGALQYQRTYSEMEGDFTSYVGPEPIIKKVDLNTAWNASEVEFKEVEDNRSWSFDLAATNLPYVLLAENATEAVGDGVLNAFRLSFNLEATTVQVDNASLPQWRITVTTGPLGASTLILPERIDDIQIVGNLIKYDVKWDQTIEGWDFDPANENPTLIMEMQNIVGNLIPPLMAKWMDTRLLTYMNAVGVMTCESSAGTLEVNDTTGPLPAVRQLTATRLTFGSDWTEIGVLTWVDDVMVDGEPAMVKAQVMAGHRVLAFGEGQTRFDGFVALTGLTFPGGSLIVHDPTFSSEALVDVSFVRESSLPIVFIGLAAIVVAIVIVALAVISSGKDKPKRGVKHSYERSRDSKPGEWEKYYNRK
ncbi:TPA: hypothetical protein HA259_00590 [Thermoplasmata archaeon]|nr:hypothetical protein [Thermoplasmata archaeon]